MSDYGSGYTFDSNGTPIASGGMGLPDPSTIYGNNDGSTTPAGQIVSGSFGNNGGSAGDNGANGGGSAGTDNGTGSQGQNPGAPTSADYQDLVKKFGTAGANQIMQQVVKDNPGWASTISSFVPGLAKAITSGSPTGTTNNGSGAITDPMALAAAGGLAYQQFHNAGQYTQQAEKYAGVLNPYGAYRDAAAQKLAALQADPSSIQDTPGYKFALSQGLGAVGNRDNRSFGVGAGSTNPDMMTFAQGLASKTYNDTIQQYSNQAGVGIGPQAAAGILQTGMQGNIASQNNAINALMSPFGPGNNTGGGGTGPIDWSKMFGGSVNTSGLNLNQQPPGQDVVPFSAGGQPPPNGTTGVIPGGT